MEGGGCKVGVPLHRGYIKIWRCIEDWEWCDDLQTTGFFIKLILMANWQDKKWHGQLVKRGQFISSTENLRFKQGRGKNKKRLTTTQVRTLVTRLKTTNELASQATSQYTIYTIVNYDKYQEKEFSIANETASQATNEQQTNSKRTATTKELEELKNEKNPPKPPLFIGAASGYPTGPGRAPIEQNKTQTSEAHVTSYEFKKWDDLDSNDIAYLISEAFKAQGKSGWTMDEKREMLATLKSLEGKHQVPIRKEKGNGQFQNV